MGIKEEFEDKLKELEGELYGKEKKDEEYVDARARHSIFPSGASRTPPTSWTQELGSRTSAVFSPRVMLKFFLLGLGLFVLVSGVVLGFLYLGKRGDEVELTIGGRDRIEAGELVTVPVSIRNVTRVPLKEVEVTILLPERTIIKEENAEHYAPSRMLQKFDTIGPQEEKTVELALRFFGRDGEDRNIDATVLYRPENLRAKFSAHANRIFTIAHVPFALSWEAPETVTQNQEVEIRVHYISNARAQVDNLSLRLNYPPGFTLISSEPQSSKGQPEWVVGTLTPGQSQTVTLKGTLSGEEGEIKTFHGELGFYDQGARAWFPYSESNYEARIARAPLSVQGFLAGERDHMVSPGDSLSLTLKYKNNTHAVLKNVALRASVDEMFALSSGTFSNQNAAPALLLFQTLAVGEGGVFESSSRQVIWGPVGLAALRELKPGDEGQVSFSIGTRQRPLMKNGQEKNIVIRLRSSIGAADIPQELVGIAVGSEDTAQFKVRTKILFAGKSVYRASPIINGGPFPPRVGQKTTYAAVWELKNFTSDLENVEIRAPIPPNVKWEGIISPRDAKITFDSSSGEIIWRAGTVKAGTGIVMPSLVGAAQLSIVPTEADIGDMPTLVTESRLSSRDSFTGESVNETLKSLTTAVREDPGTVDQQWHVVK